MDNVIDKTSEPVNVNNYDTDKIDILRTLGRPACLEQLAEEASELSQAALKLARCLRDENPTPKNEQQCYDALIEEYTDVINCTEILEIEHDQEMLEYKRKRWKIRIKERYDNMLIKFIQ